ncbi:MAG: hypothetical protein WA876_16845 [Candidatus Acidiferrales bacterium]
MKFRPSHVSLALAAGLFLCGTLFLFAPRNSRAQEGVLESEREITARAHLFPDVGLGIKAMKRDSQGRYYFLSTVDHAVRVYTADNTFLSQIPHADSGPAAIVDGEDFDVDAAGRIYVADRGANAVKVYAPDGSLSLSIRVDSPCSVVALASGQIAVASLKSRQLVVIYDAHGKSLREFGDISDLADHEEFNRFLNIGQLASDPASHIYYAFTYTPEPTVRKYDPFGHSPYEISLHTLDIYPSAQAQRRDISRIDMQNTPQPPPPVVINAIGVDPQTEEVWLSLGDYLMKFDKSGNRLESYRTLTTSSEDLPASAILIEPHRILLADDPHGIFEFARPDLPSVPPAKAK